MRLTPVPLFFAKARREAIERSAESSRTTHGTREAIDGCRYLGALPVGAVSGTGKEELLSERYWPVAGYWEEHPLPPGIDRVPSGSFERKEPPEIRGSGYVVASLVEAALWAFHRSDPFQEGCLLAANLGDDADTTAAVYGQLADAFYGEGVIPEPWRTKLAYRPFDGAEYLAYSHSGQSPRDSYADYRIHGFAPDPETVEIVPGALSRVAAPGEYLQRRRSERHLG